MLQEGKDRMEQTFVDLSYVKVKRYKRGTHKRCLHCNRIATITALRKRRGERNGIKLPVRYCEECAAMRGVPL